MRYPFHVHHYPRMNRGETRARAMLGDSLDDLTWFGVIDGWFKVERSVFPEEFRYDRLIFRKLPQFPQPRQTEKHAGSLIA